MADLANLVIEQGEDFDASFQFLDADDANAYDFTDCTARMQIRAEPDGDVVLELTTENARLSLDAETCTLSIALTAEETTDLNINGVYDVEVVYPDDAVDRVIQGVVITDHEVTA